MASPPFLFTPPPSRCRGLASHEGRPDSIGTSAYRVDSTSAAALTYPQAHATAEPELARHQLGIMAWPQPGGKEVKSEACQWGVASSKITGSPAK